MCLVILDSNRQMVKAHLFEVGETYYANETLDSLVVRGYKVLKVRRDMQEMYQLYPFYNTGKPTYMLHSEYVAEMDEPNDFRGQPTSILSQQHVGIHCYINHEHAMVALNRMGGSPNTILALARVEIKFNDVIAFGYHTTDYMLGVVARKVYLGDDLPAFNFGGEIVLANAGDPKITTGLLLHNYVVNMNRKLRDAR